ncbi:MAG: hypothetical protein HYV97_16595 [Bdellovibrio sp.]|nr:hypothetical protein [Bdellovibrio sp.]
MQTASTQDSENSSLNLNYDSIGRMLLKRLTKGADVTEYQFFYDGSNLPVSEREGQKGFLTGVHSAQFSKTFKYRVDGKKIEEKVTIPGYKELKLEYSYYTQGTLKEEIRTLTDLAFKGKNLQTVSRMRYENNEYGDLGVIIRTGTEFADINYTEFGELDTVYIENIKGIRLAYDPTSRIVKSYIEELGPLIFIKQDFNYSNRGLISESNFKFEERTVENAYSYSPRGFLQTASTDDSESSDTNLSYQFDSVGLMNSETRNGIQTNHTMTETSWQIGSNNYQLDTLGRVIQKNSKFFNYGENGRIKNVSENATILASYYYDEENNPLLKVYPNSDKELYFNDLTIIKNDFYEPLKIGSRLVGHFKNNNFINNSFDHLSTTLIDEEGQVNLPLPFGERDARTELFKAFDYTSKGFDEEIGAVRIGQRYYDPIAKRFLTPDYYYLENAIEIQRSPGESHIVGYTNDPVNLTDPTGNKVDVFSRSVEGTRDAGRHLFIKISERPNNAPDRIISLSGKTLGGTPTVNTTTGFANDRNAIKNNQIKDSQTVSVPKGITQEQFEQKIINFAEKYKVNAPENKYPALGGARQSGVRNSNTFVDDAIESSGGVIKDFDKALHQNSGDRLRSTTIDSSGNAYETTR